MRERLTRNETLIDFALTQGHCIIYTDLPETRSMSIQENRCSIGLDTKLTVVEETVCLAHELGHCETGSFYNIYSPCDIRQKYENCADRWAIKNLIPKDELAVAVSRGYTELWDLAEHFNVTEPLMLKAVEYYKQIPTGFENA